jgi:hypothetical protein
MDNHGILEREKLNYSYFGKRSLINYSLFYYSISININTAYLNKNGEFDDNLQVQIFPLLVVPSSKPFFCLFSYFSPKLIKPH